MQVLMKTMQSDPPSFKTYEVRVCPMHEFLFVFYANWMFSHLPAAGLDATPLILQEYEKSGDKVDFKPSRSLKSFLPKMLHKSPEKRYASQKPSVPHLDIIYNLIYFVSCITVSRICFAPPCLHPTYHAWQKHGIQVAQLYIFEKRAEFANRWSSGISGVATIQSNAPNRV